MTQRRLDHAVAGATGESLRTVRRLGFTIPSALPDGEDPEGLFLAVDCPFCRQGVPYPGPACDGPDAPAECPACDIYFDCGPDDIYASGPVPARAAG